MKYATFTGECVKHIELVLLECKSAKFNLSTRDGWKEKWSLYCWLQWC